MNELSSWAVVVAFAPLVKVPWEEPLELLLDLPARLLVRHGPRKPHLTFKMFREH